MFITLPKTSCVEDWIIKFSKSVLACIVAPCAVAAVGFMTVKFIVQSVLGVTVRG